MHPCPTLTIHTRAYLHPALLTSASLQSPTLPTFPFLPLLSLPHLPPSPPYHWWELPQVSFLLQQRVWNMPLSFVATEIFFHDKYIFVTKLLSWQAYFCPNKRRVLLRQTRVCHDKTFAATKMMLVAAPYLPASIKTSFSALPVYWAIQAGLLTPLTFARHRLSPLAAFTSGAYFLHNGRQWQWIWEFYIANVKGIFWGT